MCGGGGGLQRHAVAADCGSGKLQLRAVTAAHCSVGDKMQRRRTAAVSETAAAVAENCSGGRLQRCVVAVCSSSMQ